MQLPKINKFKVVVVIIIFIVMLVILCQSKSDSDSAGDHLPDTAGFGYGKGE